MSNPVTGSVFISFLARTCLVVLASLYISVSSSLPTTATIKPVELWLLFNLAYPVLVILLNVLLQVKQFYQDIIVNG